MSQTTRQPLLFVYGSLRRRARAQHRLRGAVFVGLASITGRLYELGPYPAACPSRRGRERVQGELYRLPRAATLVVLDRYEDASTPAGGEYRRALAPVACAGRHRPAWVYWYARPLRGARRLPGGVWRP